MTKYMIIKEIVVNCTLTFSQINEDFYFENHPMFHDLQVSLYLSKLHILCYILRGYVCLNMEDCLEQEQDSIIHFCLYI